MISQLSAKYQIGAIHTADTMWWFVTESIRESSSFIPAQHSANSIRWHTQSVFPTVSVTGWRRLCLDLTWPYYTRKPDTRANRVPDGFRLCLDLTWPYYTRKPDTRANRDTGMSLCWPTGRMWIWEIVMILSSLSASEWSLSASEWTQWSGSLLSHSK